MALLDGYFDESGKFRDHAVVAFGGVIGTGEQVVSFGDDWDRLLRKYGLASLTMKKALRHDRPLSSEVPVLGVEARNNSLGEFVDCAKKHFGAIVGFAVDAQAFKHLSGPARRQLTENPQYAAFARTVIEFLKILRGKHEANIICDDEEEISLPVYKLYRKIKLCYPEARKRLVSFTLADDEFFAPLQAADMCAAILRLEARRRFLEEPNEYTGLYERLTGEIGGIQAPVTIGLIGKSQIAALSQTFHEFETAYGKYGASPLVEK